MVDVALINCLDKKFLGCGLDGLVQVVVAALEVVGAVDLVTLCSSGSCWHHGKRAWIGWGDVRLAVALATVLGCADDDAHVAQIVVVVFGWDAGREVLELLDGSGTALALRSVARLIHTCECRGRG